MRWSAALLFREHVRGMVMWFRTLAESVVRIEVDHGMTLDISR